MTVVNPRPNMRPFQLTLSGESLSFHENGFLPHLAFSISNLDLHLGKKSDAVGWIFKSQKSTIGIHSVFN